MKTTWGSSGVLARLARLFLRLFFREIVIEGRDRLPAAGPVVFAPNHPNSLLDPLFMAFFSPPFRLRFVAKHQLFRLPVLGWLLRRWEAIPVVRRFEAQGPVDYAPFFETCVKALGEGASLTIFPEGRSLPRADLAPLRTGPARILLMARERGIEARLVPVALNYERPWMFRSAVQVSVGSPLDPCCLGQGPNAARDLTRALAASLEALVLQADSYRDRELMLVLDRVYAAEEAAGSWGERVARLKLFEQGSKQLESVASEPLARLRRQVERYARLAGPGDARRAPDRRALSRAALGLPFYLAGALLNWPPYRLCGWLVGRDRHDEAAAATHKVVYGLILYPVCWLLEVLAAGVWLGWPAAAALGLAIPPLSWLALRYLDWQLETGGAGAVLRGWLSGRGSRRSLERLRREIVAAVDALAALLDSEVGRGPQG